MTFDLGAMQDDGNLAENPELLNGIPGYGTLEAITRTESFALLEHYCDPFRDLLKPKSCQVSIGIGLGGGGGLESVKYSKQTASRPRRKTRCRDYKCWTQFPGTNGTSAASSPTLDHCQL